MHDDPSQRLAELKRQFERQNDEWRQIAERIQELACFPIALSPRVLEQIDEAFAAPPPVSVLAFPHHLFR
jgi:hypothetical protein